MVVVAALAVVVGYGITQPSWLDGADDQEVGAQLPPDTDGDGLLDEVEEAGWTTRFGTEYRTDPENAYTDGDGLTDADEAGDELPYAQSESAYFGYSDPLTPDTDGDGLGDGDEADHGIDPYDRDSDDDELEDGPEVKVVGSAPGLADTDGDGLDDGYEDAHREDEGIDPLVVDVRVSKASYISDFVKGALLGELDREDSLAWLAGNLASGGASLIPGAGWVVGGLADLRDAIGAAIHGDWVGTGFSAFGAVPYGGDAAALPVTVAKFVERNPELAAAVAALVVSLKGLPEKVKVNSAKKIWPSWGDLRKAGVSDKVLLKLQKGRTDLGGLADAMKRPTHVPGPAAKFFANGDEGEKWLEGLYGASANGVNRQVRASTEACVAVCNPSNLRVFDVLVDGVAHESKVGYKTLTSELERQIASDAHLIKNGDITGAHWHFFASSHNNMMGASRQVYDRLDEAGIPYTVHPPAKP